MQLLESFIGQKKSDSPGESLFFLSCSRADPVRALPSRRIFEYNGNM